MIEIFPHSLDDPSEVHQLEWLLTNGLGGVCLRNGISCFKPALPWIFHTGSPTANRAEVNGSQVGRRIAL